MSGRWLMRDLRTRRVVRAPPCPPSEELSFLAQIHGARTLNASNGRVDALAATAQFNRSEQNKVATTEDDEKDAWVSDATDEYQADVSCEQVCECPAALPLSTPSPTTPLRALGIVTRARRAFAKIAGEDGAFLSYVLQLLRTESVDDIYDVHGDRWLIRRTVGDAHMFKIAQKTGTCGVVVLAMISKDNTRALVVNVFRRTHKKGQFYRTTTADAEVLRAMDGDAFNTLAPLCA